MSGPENPPAFPRDERYLGHNGMTLRDWFAGQALSGLLANEGWMDAVANAMRVLGYSDKDGFFQESVADGAYEYADAMLVARNTGAQS